MQTFTDDLYEEIHPTGELANEKSLAELPVSVEPPTDMECNKALPAEELANDDPSEEQDDEGSPSEEQIGEDPTPKGALDEDSLIEEPVYKQSYTEEQPEPNINKEGIDNNQTADEPVESDISDDDKDPDYAMSCNESSNSTDYDEYFPNQNNDSAAKDSKKKKVKEIRKRKFEGLSENIGILPKKPIKDGCKQIYDKVNYCKFCQKEIKSKISRHLLQVHKDEVEVTNILLLPAKGKERTLRLELLANEGNFMHNTEVIKSGIGNLVVARRSGADSEIFHTKSDYLPCEHCKKFILKTSLWLHNKNCPVFHFFHEGDETCGNCSDDNSIPIATNAVRKAKTLLHGCILDDDNEILTGLFDRMHDGPIKDVVEQDKLIKRFCALKLESLGDPDDQKLNDMHRVSQSARSLARLVLEARKTQPKVDMNKLLQPDNFELCVKATKALLRENFHICCG